MSIICLLSFSFARLLFDTISFLLKNNRWKLFQPLSDQVQFSWWWKSKIYNQILKLATYLLVDITLLSKQDLGKTLLNKSRYFNQLEIGSKIPTGYQNPTVIFSEPFVDSDCPLSHPLTKQPRNSLSIPFIQVSFFNHVLNFTYVWWEHRLFCLVFFVMCWQSRSPLLPFHSQAVRRSVLSLKMRQGNNGATSD